MAVSLWISIFLGLGLWFLRDQLVNSLVEWGYKRQSLTMDRISLPNCGRLNIPMFCAIAAGDEPYLAISATRAISGLPYNVWFRSVVITIALLAAALAFLSFSTLTVGSPRPLDILILVLIPVVIIFGFLLRLLLPFVTLSRFIFGGGGAESWLTYTTVTPIPPGFSVAANGLGLSLKQPAGIENLRFKRYRIRGRGLRHSLIYSSEDFLHDLKSLVSQAAESEAIRQEQP